MFYKILAIHILLFSTIAWADGPDEPDDSCETVKDCVAESDCHPTRAINKKFRKTSKGVMCTMDCRTLLDCGRGEIKCEEKKCVVRPKSGK